LSVPPFARFLAVSVLGLVLDLGLAWLLAVKVGLALSAAAAIGFLAAAVFNYLMHEIWTFRTGVVQVSARRGGLYALALGVTLVVRVGTVALLERMWLVEGREFAVLLAATGLSFLANYMLSRNVVFRPPL
jgi:putative flippase GtrA